MLCIQDPLYSLKQLMEVGTKKTSAFTDDIERLSNLTNIQLGIGSRNCIFFHDETLGGRVSVQIKKMIV